MSIAIAGVSAVQVGKVLDRPLADTAAQVILHALEDAGLRASSVDGLFATPPTSHGEPGSMWAAGLADFIGLQTRHQVQVESGGMSAMVALRAAMDAVALRRCRVAVVLATDLRPDLDTTHMEAFLRRAVYGSIAQYGPVNGLLGLGTPVPLLAMSYQRYLYEHDLSEEAVSWASVILRSHAMEHPLSQYGDPINVADVLASPMVSPPIHLLHAAGQSAGVAAVVVTSDDLPRGNNQPVVKLVGWGEHHEPTHFVSQRSALTSFPAVRRAAAQAYEAAHRKASDVDVAEVCGTTAASECILYEDLGFCPRGRATAWLAEQRTTFFGDIVINPSGGRLSLGHPAGATPLYEVVEIVRQLRHEAPGGQVPDATLGMVQADHGLCSGAAVALFEREVR